MKIYTLIRFLLFLQIISASLMSQEIKNLEQIFYAPGVALYECSASPFGEYVSFRQSAQKNDSHWVLHLNSLELIPVLEKADDLFGGTKKSSQNLLWSPESPGKLRVKIFDDGASIHEVTFKSSIKSKDSQLNLDLDANQLLTCTQLCWSVSKKLLLSLCKADIPITSEIDASKYDAWFIPSRNGRRQNMSKNPEVREMSASPLGRNDFIISGVGIRGNIDLYKTNRSKGLIQITSTSEIAETWPLVSPDEKWVAFCDAGKGIDNNADLYILNLESEASHSLKLLENIYIPSTGVSSEGVYQWSNDSRGLYFIQKDQELKNPISYVTIETSNVVNIPSELVFVSSFAITENETKVFAIAAGSEHTEDRISFRAFLGDLTH